MDETTWGALALVLTLLGGGYTWWAYQHRGTAAALRGSALTLLPVAAWLTGTLRLIGQIVDAVVTWATRLVFSPTVWLGVGLAGLSVVLLVIVGFMRERGLGEQPRRSSTPKQAKQSPQTGQTGQTGQRSTRGRALPKTAAAKSEPVVDDELADIEAILRKRGIT